MGVITVEKCVFYIINKDVKTRLRGPDSRPDRDDAEPRQGFRTDTLVRVARIPYMGGLEKTIGYLHTSHIEGPETEFRHSGLQPKDVGANLASIREFMLGKGRWKHPNLIVADVPSPNYLMTGKDMAAYYVHLAKQSARIPRDLKPKLPNPRPFELWLPWDPTQRGRTPAKLSTTQRHVQQVLKTTSRLEFGKTRPAQDDDLGFDATGKALVIGTGFRLKFYNIPPPDIHWVPEIQNRVLDHLRKSGVKNADEWYAIGKFDPAWDYPDLVDRFRGRKFQTYTDSGGVQPTHQEALIVRRILKVKARNPDEAKRRIMTHLHQMAQNPATRKIAVERALAWSRTGERVVSRPAWDVMVKRKARLDEELYSSTSPERVY